MKLSYLGQIPLALLSVLLYIPLTHNYKGFLMLNGQDQRPHIRVAGYGVPGCGKSTFFATFPKPMCVLFTDPLGQETPYLRRGLVDRTVYEGEFGQRVTRVMSRKDPSKLLIEINHFNDPDPENPQARDQLGGRLKRLQNEEVPHGMWQTVVFDGVTFLEISLVLL